MAVVDLKQVSGAVEQTSGQKCFTVVLRDDPETTTATTYVFAYTLAEATALATYLVGKNLGSGYDFSAMEAVKSVTNTKGFKYINFGKI